MDNMRDNAYNQIKYRIIHFEYVPKQKISEKTISTELNLGRTPVREALIRIEREGLIEVVPQSGTYITQIDMRAAIEGRFVRECIEPNIMVNAVTNISEESLNALKQNLEHQLTSAQNSDPDKFFDLDQEFHQKFYTVTNKEMVWDWLLGNNTQLNRFRRLRLKEADLDWKTLLNQHQAIFNAVANKDVDELSYLMKEHLHLMLEEKQNVVNAYPDYFQNIIKEEN
ncbi:GntR family transcriptional regulator [Pediococcus pentosaceus]|jgi:DNA-binding GntR family transcriptional regulator|uniref:GntR family transcriptional regulator n=1 Tax=Pediococcus pentosaceus TaxID=1255 RepID=UPI000258AE06|nr:GntR family transcriptional regulator [Pediococcus pentosaceus]MCI1336476.1 GntR family transcriptional regulator [Lactobacillus crispatus]ANI96982.1 transcriptional regulator [Pediococcus pentosaceus]ASC09138.1 putative HTH-type transcriptional regulator YdhC [Pediococcus pentosaceus]KQB82541.1 transcriptional regulator [Pediococcus pentosaceus]KRN48042.1 GntR family transcriptional regulator [Pediococcus pentosaceus]